MYLHLSFCSFRVEQSIRHKTINILDGTPLEDLNTNRITRILTTDFPQYFAVITRIRQELHTIGPDGGLVNSSVVPQVNRATHNTLNKTHHSATNISIDIYIYRLPLVMERLKSKHNSHIII